MDLSALTQLGRVEKEIELSKDWKIRLHTLSVVEQQQALRTLPQDVEDDLTKLTYLQMAMLISATDTINGEKVTKEELKKLYSDMQNNVLASLFSRYLEINADQNKIIDELKKN